MTAPSTAVSSDLNGVSLPVGGETIANVEALSLLTQNQAGQDSETGRDHYYAIPSLTITGSGSSSVMSAIGSTGTHAGTKWNHASPGTANYYATYTAYGDLGQVERVENPDGVIRRMVHDSLGRLTIWIGTDDTPGSSDDEWSPTNNGGDMVEVSACVYDDGGVGDSNLTEEVNLPAGNGGSAANFRVIVSSYDWRDRVVNTKQVASSGRNRPNPPAASIFIWWPFRLDCVRSER